MKYFTLILLAFPMMLNAQGEPPPPPPYPEPPMPPQEEEIHEFADPEAKYPGGMEALMKDLTENLVYPDSAINNNIQGKVYIEFVVETTGKLSNIKVLKGIGYGCDQAAIHAVKNLKPWIPAEINGKPIRQRFRLPVIFKLQD